MKRQATKVLCVLLALAMLLTLAACGNRDSAPAADKDASNAFQETEQADTAGSAQEDAAEPKQADTAGTEQADTAEPEQTDAAESEQADEAEPEQPDIIPLNDVLFDNEDFYVAVVGFDTSYEVNDKIMQGLIIDFANRTTETDINSPDYVLARLDIEDVVVNGCRAFSASHLNGYDLDEVEPGTSAQNIRFCSPSNSSGIRYIDTLDFRCVIRNGHDDILYEDTFTLEIHAGEGEATYTPEFDGAPFSMVETDQCQVELSGYTDEPDTGIRRYIIHTVNNTDQEIHVDIFRYYVNSIEDDNSYSYFATVQPHTDHYDSFYLLPQSLIDRGISTVASLGFSPLYCYYWINQEDGSREKESIAEVNITIPDPGTTLGPLIDPDEGAGE